MSYVVHIWEYPEPRTLQSADSIHNMLAGQRSRPNFKWRLLAERVEARMAELGSPLEAWPDGSPPGPDHAERTMPILIDEQGEFLEVLIDVATSLGMCVYDDQAARLYLPFGCVLTWDGLQRLRVAPPTLGAAQLEDVIDSCERAWAARFAALGYALRREPYDEACGAHLLIAERPVSSGRQTVEIHFSADKKKDTLSTDVYAYAWLDLPAAAQAAAQGVQRVEVRGKELRGMSALMLIPNRSVDWITIGGALRTQAHVDRLIEGFFEYYDQELGPTLDEMREPGDVLRLALGEQDAPGELRNSRALLALAWAQDDATLERLFARIRERDRYWIEDWGNAVYEALRQIPR